MDHPTRSSRPAPRLAATPGSFADHAQKSPVSRWALVLQDAEDIARRADVTWLAHEEGKDLALDQSIKADAEICENVYSPVQRALLRESANSIEDALIIAGIASSLSQHIAGNNLGNDDLSADARAVDLALAALTTFLLEMQADQKADKTSDITGLPKVAQDAITRAFLRHAARFSALAA